MPRGRVLKPLHPSAGKFARSGIFDDLDRFSDLEARISALPIAKDEGDAFEVFVEGLIATHHLYQAKQIWPGSTVPSKIIRKLGLSRTGIGGDGVFEDRNDEFTAYEVKFRANRRVPYEEVAKFTTAAEGADDRLFFTNGHDLNSFVKTRENFRAVLGHDFDALSAEELSEISDWLKTGLVRPKPRDPLPHQGEALDQIVPALKEMPRATAVMACGTGKTMVALWTAERLEARRILVLMPSLALVKQTLEEWSRWSQWGDDYRFMCVCSDPKVGSGVDSWVLDPMDTGFRVSTEPEQVTEFLSKSANAVQVIYSTYQSAHIVAEGLKDGQSFDLAILDEAHKTTGREGTKFAFALKDENIPIDRRLFLTATPRHYNIRKRNKDGDFDVASMDDEAIYGPIAYRLPFAEAAKRDIICDYRILISVVTQSELADRLATNATTLVDGDEVSSEWVAHQVALEKAVEKVGATHIITFHSNISMASEFAAKDVGTGIGGHLPEFETFHVSGKQSTADRTHHVDLFRDAEKSLISNARCLTEGVDVPAVDMVAFMNPRRSRVDIVQAIGRAMRKAGPDKKLGYVVVPLFLDREADETIEDALKRAGFEVVANVVNAMREQDDDLIDIIREMRVELGRNESFDSKGLSEKIEVIGPSIDLPDIRNAIEAEIVERLGSNWDEMYGRLILYKAEYGNCDVAYNYSDKQLAAWVDRQRQRYRKGLLDLNYAERLDAIGFDWDPIESLWELMFKRLVAYEAENGDCNVPQNYPDKQLANWVSTQRAFYRKGVLNSENTERLNAIKFDWYPAKTTWELMFQRLVAYKVKNGDCVVPKNYAYKPLATWVDKQRQRHRNGVLDPEHIERLDAIGFDWDPIGSLWELMFKRLVAYEAENGDCDVPQNYSDKQLARWVSGQRTSYKQETLSPEHIERLNAIAFDWDPAKTKWEQMFELLVAYKGENGDCDVPRNYPDKKLANWVTNHRASCKRGTLNPEYVERLSAIGFDWDPIKSLWERMFEHLVAYKSENGDYNVSKGYSDKQLATWVNNLRASYKKGTLDPEYVERLNAIGFVWKLRGAGKN